MRIRKTQQPAEYPKNQIHDAYNMSTTDTYSCNYINNITIEESGDNYVKYGNGTMECWGTVDFGSINGTTGKTISVSLPKSYSNTDYNIQLTKVARGNDYTFIIESLTEIEKNKFNILGWNNRSETSTVDKYKWRTFGYWK